ncbi:hypothetical protein E8E01_00625 [Methylorubrum populi]|uniref:hypothetical protein n=1 Tax=Methylorubrum populi TaxID=223967 RepID=UPI0011517D51|nr:hypothetical protein [Methylorubrum populi]QDI79053.1 hypothetical protein E8E01_00625 [Methylorubrum populi]
MPRVIVIAALLVLCAPAWAGPARRQPTPESIRTGMEGAAAGRADAATGPNRVTGEGDVRSREWDRKVKKSLGGICQGC